tara:strand:- start:666 stop:1751 length:1086 start_codon:yes stop_codon:yes gene_type:complete
MSSGSADALKRSHRKGRGALSNRCGRFESLQREDVDDGWDSLEVPPQRLTTRVELDTSKSVVSHNDSPDVMFTNSINPYRGCEHGCIYCFARPTHTYLGLSAGQDFESRLFYKRDAAAQLRAYLSRHSYECDPITLGANTDPYQPIEKRYQVTRQVIEVLHECRHPMTIVTKNAMVERDLDLLAPMSELGLVNVCLTVTSLDSALTRKLEPRTSAPARRLTTIARLSDAGVPVTVLVSPVIPFINDSEIEEILAAVRECGAIAARYSVVRLPLEVKGLFVEWVKHHFPMRADHVLSRITDLHGGKIYDPTFGKRQAGQGELASLIGNRFRIAKRRLGFRDPRRLRTGHFVPPSVDGQYSLF